MIQQEYSTSLQLTLFGLRQVRKTPTEAKTPSSFSFENQNSIKYFWYFVTFCKYLISINYQTSLPSFKIWPMAININHCDFWGLIYAIDTKVGPQILCQHWNKSKQKYTSFIRKKNQGVKFWVCKSFITLVLWSFEIWRLKLLIPIIIFQISTSFY